MDQSEGGLPSRLEHVMVGQILEPDDLRYLALELYRREHGMCWTGEVLTARMVNIVVDWWNARDNVPTTPDAPTED